MDTDTAPTSTAAELGYRAGHADAAWVFDGNTPECAYHACLRLDDEGDPAWWDHYGPAGPDPLAGQWADEPTPATVAAELGIDPSTDPDALDAACADYEHAYFDGWCDAVLTTARRHTGKPTAN